MRDRAASVVLQLAALPQDVPPDIAVDAAQARPLASAAVRVAASAVPGERPAYPPPPRIFVLVVPL